MPANRLIQLQGHRHDCAQRPFEVSKNERTSGANVSYDMPGSRAGSIPIIRGKVCNRLARCFPALQLACRPVSQPLSQPLARLPSGRLETQSIGKAWLCINSSQTGLGPGLYHSRAAGGKAARLDRMDTQAAAQLYRRARRLIMASRWRAVYRVAHEKPIVHRDLKLETSQDRKAAHDHSIRPSERQRESAPDHSERSAYQLRRDPAGSTHQPARASRGE